MKATREKQLVMHKRVPIRLSADFQQRFCSLERSGMINSMEKKKTTVNQEYDIQQNNPLKEEERLSQTKDEEVYHHLIRPI